MAEIVILIVSYLEVYMYFYRIALTNIALEKFRETYGNSYIRIDSAVLADQYYLYLLAFIMFVSILKLIKLLQFNKRMGVLALTIQLCWDELSYFFIAFGVIFCAFCFLFFFMFLTQIRDFSTVLSSIATCFNMMLGKFDFEAMSRANALSPILFFTFSVLNSMVLINIMLAIIIRAFTEIKVDLKRQENKYNVLDYMWYSLKKLCLRQPNPVHQVKVDMSENRNETDNDYDQGTDAHLPEKVRGYHSSTHVLSI